MKNSKSNIKSGAVQPEARIENNPETLAAASVSTVNDNMTMSAAWSSIQAGFGMSLPYIVIEHLFDTVDALGLQVNSSQSEMSKLNNFEQAVRRTGLGYFRLRERVRARALAELPLVGHELVPTLGMAGLMVDEAFHEAIKETEHALYRRPIYLDYFGDCIYPIVKQKLQARLGLAIEPATVFQTWLLDIEG